MTSETAIDTTTGAGTGRTKHGRRSHRGTSTSGTSSTPGMNDGTSGTAVSDPSSSTTPR
jgi:hypothetical protein